MPSVRNTDPGQRKAELNDWLENNKHMHGAVILQYLIRYENLPVHVAFMDHYISRGYPAARWPQYAEAAAHGLVCTAEQLKLADARTVTECRDRFNKLKQLYQAYFDLGDDLRAEKTAAEMRQLNKYMKEVRAKNGSIRTFPATWSSSYHMAYSNLARLRTKLRQERPELAAYLKQHLRTGQWFTWSDPEGKTPPWMAQSAHWTHKNI